MNELQHKIQVQRESNISYKIYLSLQISFYMASNVEEITSPHPTFNSKALVILPTTNLDPVIKILYDNLLH